MGEVKSEKARVRAVFAFKAYRCPACGAEIRLRDVDTHADTMLCRVCGKVHSCGEMVRRESVNGELGQPPPGVKVVTGVVRPDALCEDLIVYSHRNFAAILLFMWWGGIWGFGAVSLLSRCDWLFGVLACVVCLLSIAWLVFVVFGRTTLRLSQSGGVYVVKLWGLRKQVRFGISRETDARVDEYQNPGLMINRGCTIREIAVMSGKVCEASFARSLPRDVQEFFCKCIARRAAGVPLKDMYGGLAWSRVAHPVALGVILVAIAACFAYAFSAREHLNASDGVLTIEETKWWGREAVVSKIPFKDISYIDFIGRGRNSCELDVLGKDRRVIRRLCGYGREASSYQTGLMQAIRCSPGVPFDRSRFTNLFFFGLGLFLLLPAAFACGGFEIESKADKEEWE